MSAPRGKSDGFSIPKIEKPSGWLPKNQSHLDTRSVFIPAADLPIVRDTAQELPLLAETWDAVTYQLGHEPQLQVDLDPEYRDACELYDMLRDELKALARA